MNGLYTRTEDVLAAYNRRGGVFIAVHDRTGRPLCGCGRTRYDFRRSPFCRTAHSWNRYGCNLTQPDFHCDGHFPFNRFSWRARELYALAFLRTLAKSQGLTFDELRCAIATFRPTLVTDSHAVVENEAYNAMPVRLRPQRKDA